MKKGKNNHGFTLGELLIVVGIIAVLVAISIPIFNKQLERSRDAASIANIRSMYSQCQIAHLEMEESGERQVKMDGVWYTVKERRPDGTIWTLYTNSVLNIESKEANKWSGMDKNLPFEWNNTTTRYDIGIPGKYRMYITYNADGSTKSVQVYQRN